MFDPEGGAGGELRHKICTRHNVIYPKKRYIISILKCIKYDKQGFARFIYKELDSAWEMATGWTIEIAVD